MSLRNDQKEGEYTREREAHWDNIAASASTSANISAGQRVYHEEMARIYRHLVAPGLNVLELGCGQGDLLAELKPKFGVGIDISEAMTRLAAEKHPTLRFVHGDAHIIELPNDAPKNFDVIILSDLLNDLWDAQQVLRHIRKWCTPETKIIINIWNRVWQLPLNAMRAIGKATPLLPQNWFAPSDVINLLGLEQFCVVKRFSDILLPLPIPGLRTVFNRYLSKIPLINLLSLTNVVVAKPVMAPEWAQEQPIVSVVVPARNESGNIAEIIARTPEMGGGTELIFVEGNSTDDTWQRIQQEVAKEQTRQPERKIAIMQQPGRGKGDAVRTGFAAATGKVFMILDADMTVAPEDLPRFYEALASGSCEFVNGVRLVYPMDARAMRFCNLVANKGFSLVFSWLLGQSIKDTLCGTKVLTRENYQRIVENRAYFGDFDPFGDYDLIFGASKQLLHIRDMPIRYRERTYGDTNISRWKHGIILLKMVIFAMQRIKFI